MAGQPYEAGGIGITTAATRAASDDELRSGAARRLAEARAGGTTHVEIKSGYALDVEGEARLCRLAAELTDDVTFLGAHVVPAEYAGRADEYVALVAGPDARRLRAVVPLGRRLLRGRRLRRRPDPRRPPGGRAPAAWGCGSTPTSSAPVPACSWPSSWARRRPTTAPT